MNVCYPKSGPVCLPEAYHVFKRGFLEFYSRSRKKTLYLNGRREYNYDYVRGNFIGNFPNHYCVDVEAYREKKMLYSGEEESKERMKEHDWIEESLLRGMPPMDIKQFVGCSVQNIYKIRNKLEGRENTAMSMREG